MPILFDGPNKIITLESGITNQTVSFIYSRWKEWVEISTNAKYLPAFRVVGGDLLGGGLQSGINVFIRNDLGWRIKPPEEDIIITLNGNLYSEDPNVVSMIPTTGNYDTVIKLNLSANLLQIGSGEMVLSPEDISAIATAMWNSDISNYNTPGSMAYKIRKNLIR